MTSVKTSRLVAFYGDWGSYTEGAAMEIYGKNSSLEPCKSLAEVFKMTEGDRSKFGVVPIENSTEGYVSETMDLLYDTSLKISGEMIRKISHCLIANVGVGIESIRKVYSHSQALGQCRGYLKSIGAEPVQYGSTSESVRMLKQKGLLDSGALASERAAELHGMKILARDVQDNKRNYTRFVVLSKHDSERTGADKTSMIVKIKNEPSSLHRNILEPLASGFVNITQILSRPVKSDLWEYLFYIDVDGHKRDPNLKRALGSIEERSEEMKILGSYPRASGV